MVDTWIGYLLRLVENMGLMEETAVVFTSAHGFYFGEHGGRFGKMTFARREDGRLFEHGDADGRWDQGVATPVAFVILDL
jgi:arylsulfatase A-like enzyme